MTAAAAAAGDLRDVHPGVAGAERDLVARAVELARLAHERSDADPLDRAQVVDDTLGEWLVGTGRLVVVAGQPRDEQASGRLEPRVLEGDPEEPLLGERHGLPDRREDTRGLRSGVDEPRREPERLGGRVGVLEAAGVGDEPDVSASATSGPIAIPASRSRRSTIWAVQAASGSTRSRAPNRVLSW